MIMPHKNDDWKMNTVKQLFGMEQKDECHDFYQQLSVQQCAMQKLNLSMEILRYHKGFRC